MLLELAARSKSTLLPVFRATAREYVDTVREYVRMRPRLTAPILPWQRVRVSGPSMSPTLRDGDVVLVRRARAPRRGDVVLAVFRSMPARRVLKRVAREDSTGWWLASDNPAAGGDSDSHGVADVLGVVVLRWRAGRVVPTRVARQRSNG